MPFIDARELPLPHEYRFLPLDGPAHRAAQPTSSERTVVFLDCGNLERNPAEALRRHGMRIVNIDHHHDNTLLRHRQPASTRAPRARPRSCGI